MSEKKEPIKLDDYLKTLSKEELEKIEKKVKELIENHDRRN